MSRSFVLCALAAACGHPPPASPHAGAAVPPLLLAFRNATGGAAWDHVQGIETHAAVTVGGMTGTADELDDVATGRNKSSITVGAFGQADGWDGAAAWERSVGGEVSMLDAPAAVAVAKTGAWMTRRGYFHPGGASYRELGTREGLRGLAATPDGGAPVELWFDSKGLLARTIERIGTDLTTTDYADYRAVGDVEIPFHLTIDQGDPRNKIAMTLIAAKVVPSPEAAAFTAPKVDTDRISFAGGAQTTQVPFELINNHIYIHASVDGKPVRVMVDTGGLNMLTPQSAKRLGIATEGKMAASGGGAEKADLGFGHAKRIAVGDVSLADPVFFVIDIGKLSEVEGEDVDGLIGYEMFSRLRVRIDYPARTLTLIAPAAFKPPAGAVAVPFVMEDRTPIVQGAIDGIPGRFWIDTGSRVSLTTMAKFTRDHDLTGKYKPGFQTVTGWGVGGESRSAPVRFHEVKLGDAVVHEVIGDLFTGDKGSFANPDSAGNVGGGILHRFIVTFDYGAKIMYLEPAPKAEAREIYDRSGMFLRRDGNALAVISVVPHSPAEAAGIKPEDRITAIDGVPVATRPLHEWRARLRESALGTRVKVHDERLGDVALVLAELVP